MSGLADYFREQLAGKTRIAVLGVGSELCHDDAAGPMAIERLAERLGLRVGEAGGHVLLVCGYTAPENYTGPIKAFRPDVVLLLDAAYMDLPAGSVQALPPERAAGLSFSTHMLPLPMTMDYLRLECGCGCALVGVQPATTEQGFGVSPRVEEGVNLLVDALFDALREKAGNGSEKEGERL